MSGIAEFIAEVHEVLGEKPVFYPDYIGGPLPNTQHKCVMENKAFIEGSIAMRDAGKRKG